MAVVAIQDVAVALIHIAVEQQIVADIALELEPVPVGGIQHVPDVTVDGIAIAIVPKEQEFD